MLVAQAAAPTQRLNVPAPPMLTDVVIVNWNSKELLRRCLRSLAALDPGERQGIGRVVVVDNASTDGSADVPDLAAQLPLEVMSNSSNMGFAAACNRGAAAGCGGAILFLNPDVVVAAGAIARPAGHLAAGEAAQIGIVGIKLCDADGTPQRCTVRFPTPLRLCAQSIGLDRLLPGLGVGVFDSGWDHATTRDVDQVMGAFLVIRRSLFQSLGGFDERFFVYYDDVDLCYRARLAGWRSVHLAEAHAEHDGQGTTRQVKDVRLFYILRSRLLYARKHFSKPGQTAVALATLALEPVSRAALLLARGSFSELRDLAKGYLLLYAAAPRLNDPRLRRLPVM